MTTTTLPLIGLTGRKRSGKNAAARILARHGYAEAAFADPLRALVAAIDPIVGHEVDGPYKFRPVHYREALDALGYELAKDRYPELRRNLQTTGSEGVRDTLGTEYHLRDILGDDLWIVLAERRIENAISHYTVENGGPVRVTNWGQPLVFTDVRFPNEADLIRHYGGIVVRVDRPDLGPATDLHQSETAMDDYDVDLTIANDGTLATLAQRLDILVHVYNDGA